MGVKRFDALRHIVTAGNVAPVAAGQPVWVKAGKRINYNVAPGQLVFYVKENGTTRTVDNATLVAKDVPNLFIGVGHISDKTKGIVDSIRHIGREDINGCYLKDLDVSGPRCATPEVTDFYFDCVSCGEDYTIEVAVDDNFSRSFAPVMGSKQKFWATETIDCDTCDDCPPTPTCDEVVCKLIDRLNDDIETSFYPDYKKANIEVPFRAVKLHDTSLIYCLSPLSTGSDCKDCYAFPAISEVTVDNVATTLVGTLDPADNAQTLRGQLESVADQINQLFEDGPGKHAGHAYVAGTSYSSCCPVQLHVNTCDPTFAISDGVTPLVPTKNYNPLTTHGVLTVDPACQDCDSAATTVNFTCGIRVIAAPLKGDCSCYLEKPKSMYGRTIDITPLGNGWKNNRWKVEKIQKMTFPAGFGAWIQYQEYRQPIGGSGRDYSWSNENDGWLNLPDAKSRVNNAITARCDTDYCSYRMVTEYPKTNHMEKRDFGNVYSHVHIPSNDTVTLAAWDAFLVSLTTLAPGCPPLETVECNPLAIPCVE
jgi:hypothetical protein